MKLNGRMNPFISRKRNRITLYLPFIYLGIKWQNGWRIDINLDPLWWIAVKDFIAVLSV